jgi:L-arabinokinase
VQIDSLHLDERGTLRRAAAFYAGFAAKVANEARALAKAAADLVIGDIPPLAFAAAAAADLPSIALGNFTWDWIYEGYPDWRTDAPDLIETIRAAYSTASLALRLPMFGGFAGLRPVTRDIPFVARRSRRDPQEVRQAVGIPLELPMVLVSFGRYGLRDLSTAALRDIDGYSFVTAGPTDNLAPAANLHPLNESELYAAGWRYEDLVRAADVVVTKPGYGIIAEAIANDTAVLYTSRGHFVEYDVLVAAMPRYLRALFIGHADLLAGRWKAYLDRLLALPPPPERAAVNGAEAAAEIILRQ